MRHRASGPRQRPGRSDRGNCTPPRRSRGRSLNLQLELDDHYLIALAKQGRNGRVRPDRQALLRLRPPEGVVVLPDRRRLRRPHPGGPRRPLQGGPRLPHRPRVELPQLRGALHHPSDHHRGQDLDPQQAHPAQRVRLVLADAGGRRRRRRPDARRAPARADRARPREPGDLDRGAAQPGGVPVERAVGARELGAVALPRRLLVRVDRRAARRATRRRSTTRSSA